jgi:hypothetical protein
LFLPRDSANVSPSSEIESNPRDVSHKRGQHRRGDDLGEIRQYAAPRDHGKAFVEPTWDQAGTLIDRNISVASGYGALLEDLRGRARRQLIEDAISYTGVYRDVSWVDPAQTAPLIMAGHQPALFHPGVWFKNFALSHLAQQCGVLAINLVVDNDVASGSSIRVPTLDPVSGNARYESIAYDVAGGGVPYEQTTISDRETFDRFDRRVQAAIAPLVADPCVGALWEHAKAAVQRCGVAGCALAQARHGLEGDLGLKTLEIPLGVACRGSAFAEFVLSILTELPRFRRCYNDAADHYRMVHGIRSSAHPVPNLARQDDWFEAPLWIYGNDAPTRRPAWVRLSNDHLVIADSPTPDVSGPDDLVPNAAASGPAGRPRCQVRIDVRHPKLAAEQLAAAASPHFKLRPRALLTTMYARLVLSDLFLHGIGGAKYDQLGDMIMRSYFAVVPPQFMVISATVQLPGANRHDHAADIAALRRQIRDTRYQPERFADRIAMDEDLIKRKHELLGSIPLRGGKKAWQDQISQINSQLSRSLQEYRSKLQHDLAQLQRQAASTALLASREHPFCLFPLDYLSKTFATLLK